MLLLGSLARESLPRFSSGLFPSDEESPSNKPDCAGALGIKHRAACFIYKKFGRCELDPFGRFNRYGSGNSEAYGMGEELEPYTAQQVANQIGTGERNPEQIAQQIGGGVDARQIADFMRQNGVEPDTSQRSGGPSQAAMASRNTSEQPQNAANLPPQNSGPQPPRLDPNAFGAGPFRNTIAAAARSQQGPMQQPAGQGSAPTSTGPGSAAPSRSSARGFQQPSRQAQELGSSRYAPYPQSESRMHPPAAPTRSYGGGQQSTSTSSQEETFTQSVQGHTYTEGYTTDRSPGGTAYTFKSPLGYNKNTNLEPNESLNAAIGKNPTTQKQRILMTDEPAIRFNVDQKRGHPEQNYRDGMERLLTNPGLNYRQASSDILDKGAKYLTNKKAKDFSHLGAMTREEIGKKAGQMGLFGTNREAAQKAGRKGAAITNREKTDDGKSIAAQKGGFKGAATTHSQKNPLTGQSINAEKAGKMVAHRDMQKATEAAAKKAAQRFQAKQAAIAHPLLAQHGERILQLSSQPGWTANDIAIHISQLNPGSQSLPRAPLTGDDVQKFINANRELRQ
jgi:hypothetical protein